MTAETVLNFPPFRLDLRNEQLWRDEVLVPLRPKQFAVLAYLASNPARLVTSEELLTTVWPDTYVSEGLLRSYIRQVRQALHDEAETPLFIETVPRRGYRFLPATTTTPPVSSEQGGVSGAPSLPHSLLLTPYSSLLVGRTHELYQLHEWLSKALNGERQVVFVTGEPGIGKTTLIDAFLQGLKSKVQGLKSRNTDLRPLPPDPWLARGQCIEHYGSGEAYLPVLEALGQLCRQPGGEQVVMILSRYAPTWLVQMPALLSDMEFEALQRKVQGATRERMLREMAEALEALTAGQPLVLVLEDMHWSDHSTLDLLSVVAQRRDPARLLVLATYRPADVVVSGHPLRAVKQELQLHGQCAELPLGFLTPIEVTQYLTARFPHHIFPAVLGQVLHQSTEGNPLFMLNVVDGWERQGVVREAEGQWQLTTPIEELAAGVPESLRQMIEKQLLQLTPEEQRVLETASVVGGEFSAATVAAGTTEQIERVEGWSERLAKRGQFLRARGTETLAEGTVTGRYSFLHALYPQVLYERLAPVRRIQLHRRIGEWEEQGYRTRGNKVAAELAMHFERGQDYARAVHYCHEAGQHARQRFATIEAAQHFRRGFALLPQLPETRERQQQELSLLIALATTLWLTDPEVATLYTKASALARKLNLPLQLFLTLSALQSRHIVMGEPRQAKELGRQTLALSAELNDPLLQIRASLIMAVALKHSGELQEAHDFAAEGIRLSDTLPSLGAFRKLGQHSPLVSAFCTQACALWFLGYPEQALQKSQEVLRVAEEVRSPFDMVLARGWVTIVHYYLGDLAALHSQAEAGVTVAVEHGSRLWEGIGRAIWGGSFVAQGQQEAGWAQLQQSEHILQAVPGKAFRAYALGLRAGAHLHCQQVEAGLTAITEALAVVEQLGERLWEAEIYRLKGELLLVQGSTEQSARSKAHEKQKSKDKVQKSKVLNSKFQIPDPASEAETCFIKALDIARAQQAKSLELRAVMSLVRLRQSQALGQRAKSTEQRAKNETARKREGWEARKPALRPSLLASQPPSSRLPELDAHTQFDKAHNMLVEVYGWFTEGFDTKDLQEAKTLLESLARPTTKS